MHVKLLTLKHLYRQSSDQKLVVQLAQAKPKTIHDTPKTIRHLVF